MKKLVAFAAVIAAVSFASCGNKSAENTEVAETETEATVALNPQLHSRSATYIKRNGLLIRKITIKSSRPFQCAYHPLTP